MTGTSWFGRVGWRHLVALLACLFALFPILFVASAAFNPLGTLSSSTLIPSGRQHGQLRGPVQSDQLHRTGSSTRS